VARQLRGDRPLQGSGTPRVPEQLGEIAPPILQIAFQPIYFKQVTSAASNDQLPFSCGDTCLRPADTQYQWMSWV
jgi:hypothetical protein